MPSVAANAKPRGNWKTLFNALLLSWRFRLLVLVALFAIETVLLLSLRQRGWVATTASGRWVFTLLAAALPLCIAALLIFGSGFRFKLRTMLLGIASVCVFLTLSLAPLLQARQARTASQQLRLIGIELGPTSSGDFDYENPEFSYREIKFSGPDDIPNWLMPLAGDLSLCPLDAEVVSVNLLDDDQIDAFVSSVPNLVNVKEISVSAAVTDAGIERLAASAKQLPKVNSMVIVLTDTSAEGLRCLSAFVGLRFLFVNQVLIPTDDWLCQFSELQVLHLCDERFHANPNLPNAPILPRKDFKAVTSLPNLRQLSIRGFDLKDAELTDLLDTEIDIVRVHCKGIDPAELGDYKQTKSPYWIIESL